MTRAELAEEMYNLIVIKGRWKDNKPKNGVLGDSYAESPQWVKDEWENAADDFAHQWRFTLEG